MPRNIYLILDGREREVGTLLKNNVEYRSRVIQVRPFKTLDHRDERFTVLLSLLESKGYSPSILPGGEIFLIMPQSDKYGWILREIANVYWLTRNTEGLK